MKKLLHIFILLTIVFGFVPEKVNASETGYFVVTAYYSPLPNQESYIMGSYEAEIRMNGEGIAGASGKPVFSGMLAAPGKYGFGTKIYLEGVGVGEVTDRGGAIVAAGQRGFQHDRIDIWMGYGQEGLRRAMYWGKRTVKGYVTNNTAAVTINTKNHPAPVWATDGLKKISTIPTLYNIGIGLHSSAADVKKLQEHLTINDFYAGEIDGNYNSIMGIIFQYQLDNGLVVDENTFGAGYWGNLTRNHFLKQYLNGTLEKPISEEIIKEKNTVQVIEKVPQEIVEQTVVEEKVNIFDKALTTEKEFRALQEGLKAMGLYEGEIDGDYELIRNVILDYQLGKKIIENENSIGAGMYGPKTRATLKNDITYIVEEAKRKEAEKGEMVQRRLELEAKFLELENTALDMAEQRVSEIDILQLGDISPAVRDLQMIMKDLGYFDHNDTAIYGEKTKQSVFEYQVDKGLIAFDTDAGAGVCGPVTKASLKDDLKDNYLGDLVIENDISKDDLAVGGISKF